MKDNKNIELIKSIEFKLKNDNTPEVAKALRLKLEILKGNKTVNK
ncbi:hypothetical protein M1M24_gp14 [Polaribacter phage Freya_1]|uniref:Uncharacterized protein n=1 Tax=Polaribacter phage Freya_1 TaxID=2745662 RepID=A0A8E4ZFA0_9CAUD|nr:hypothetical protein M1M24_gp14 [Polaribacter phage Freya_1]QQV90951.1 hypothetical protein Freya2_14 [Polaribacter phage Freya_2]QQV91019.1 hypothetical protein Freya3_14 [Polaribacter phage Freya_3]QQV91087.1 hypothetical protein Freya4_14 [Polaribacter phage Freya_4]QQV91162.1 hypothetical protein Freya8_21 [Polaribacter phage Freya_8]QQV91239.1 hypothetical protein Freya9_23 [Polaribacter phage Freya_9]QQV91317.1 hypothetical protein Freya10_24 [Polaribacter phage Freya_10]QYV99896.1 